ncbi:hypothetical protein HN807_06095 [Candidatus Bathyarchaeota archaeon]|jgi:hypothetical protein|nr:hypothetical protein [Candidatus Bathyarchaeota archaeon]MBT4319144.1 hypothetical protein [Candidatus Bathyarchaeota archaeon]MBT4423442.1 hypothetical protein [Candidatus Bathyarchaeota archaeon]MBT5643143.1 hypothetical protein [Candidatus Bathyarchaeota archaeon]MBT6605398.1 hypothetical protein [Candidatus Bathyarchaeota archaeon]
MSKRGKRKTRSKIEIPKKYLQAGVVLFCIFILGGGFYNILENPPSIIPLQNGYSSLHPYFTAQTSTEGYVVMLTNLFIFMGFWMIHKSTQVTYDTTGANRWLMAGIIAVFAGIASNYTLIQIKQSIL